MASLGCAGERQPSNGVVHVRVRLLAVLLCSIASTIGAQVAERIPIPYRTYIAINPLGIPFDIASAEVETAVAQGITVGGLASYTSIDHDRYTTFDAKVRYYPGEVVLRGFSVGASVGHTRFTTKDVPGALEYPSIGLLVDYNFMLGAAGRFVVGTGVGAKRVIASADDRAPFDVDRATVTLRFVLGIAF
jgi:hypothetical protein